MIVLDSETEFYADLIERCEARTWSQAELVTEVCHQIIHVMQCRDDEFVANTLLVLNSYLRAPQLAGIFV